LDEGSISNVILSAVEVADVVGVVGGGGGGLTAR